MRIAPLSLATALILGAAGSLSAQTVVPTPPAVGQTAPAAPVDPNVTVLPVTPADTAAAMAAARQVRLTCDTGGPFDATYNPGSGNVVMLMDGVSHTLAPVEGGFSDGTYRISGAFDLDHGGSERLMVYRAGALTNGATAVAAEEVIGKNCLPSTPPKP